MAEEADMTARPVMATDVIEAAIRLSEGSKGIPFGYGLKLMCEESFSATK